MLITAQIERTPVRPQELAEHMFEIDEKYHNLNNKHDHARDEVSIVPTGTSIIT